MSEDYPVKYGSPTLAGIKTGSLFSCPMTSPSGATAELAAYNRAFAGKGLCFIPARFMGDRVLVYMFRPHRLEKDLADPAARAILREAGYRGATSMALLAELMERLRSRSEFPHEIGLFLGYPAEDVSGFIKHRATGCKLVGTWKVYGDEEAAKRTFAVYRECTRIFAERFRGGKRLSELTVAV